MSYHYELSRRRVITTANATFNRVTGEKKCNCAVFGYLGECQHADSAEVMARVRGSVSADYNEERVVS